MNVSKFGKRLVLAFVATTTMFVGVPASHAAGSTALCSATGNRFDESHAVFDLACTSGTSNYLGAWHFTETNGLINGTGPNGAIAQGTTTTVTPICVIVGPTTIRYCRTVRLSVCIDNSCTYVTLYICVSYRIPRVKVCVETANTGAFDGDAVFDDNSPSVASPVHT